MAIQTVNDHIKRLHDFLVSLNLWDDTVFLLMGDHGTSIGEHDIYFSHSGLYDVSIKVPFMMRIPGVESKEVTQMTQHTDILPTLMDYLGFKDDLKFDGKSMRDVFEKDEPIRDKVLLFDGLCKNIKGVRTANKKLVIADDSFCHLCKGEHHGKIEEYDLEKDPDELTNVYNGESELKSFMV